MAPSPLHERYGPWAVVAAATLAALDRSGTVRPGLRSRLLGYALLPLPRGARVRLMGSVMAGMVPPEESGDCG